MKYIQVDLAYLKLRTVVLTNIIKNSWLVHTSLKTGHQTNFPLFYIVHVRFLWRL